MQQIREFFPLRAALRAVLCCNVENASAVERRVFMNSSMLRVGARARVLACGNLVSKAELYGGSFSLVTSRSMRVTKELLFSTLYGPLINSAGLWRVCSTRILHLMSSLARVSAVVHARHFTDCDSLREYAEK